MGVVACPVALTNQPAGAFVFNVFYDFFCIFLVAFFPVATMHDDTGDPQVGPPMKPRCDSVVPMFDLYFNFCFLFFWWLLFFFVKINGESHSHQKNIFHGEVREEIMIVPEKFSVALRGRQLALALTSWQAGAGNIATRFKKTCHQKKM